MDTLGTTKRERDHVKRLLKKKFRTLEIAAHKIKLSKFTLSRVLGGREAELSTLVKILRATGHVPANARRFPKEDLSTFYFVNGLLDADLLGNAKERGKNA